MNAETRTIATVTHGRYLVKHPAGASVGLLVGFHGYAEPADPQLDRLLTIPAASAWTCVAVQALHRFYRGQSQMIVASWMTRQDRELAIDDNRAYVSSVVREVCAERPFERIVYAGFSQGVAMAFRAAVDGDRPPAGVVAIGGDVPPELDADRLHRIPSVLIVHGETDPFHTAETVGRDRERLRQAGVSAIVERHPGGHDWGTAATHAADAFLRGLP